jgi:hypothetical protein
MIVGHAVVVEMVVKINARPLLPHPRPLPLHPQALYCGCSSRVPLCCCSGGGFVADIFYLRATRGGGGGFDAGGTAYNLSVRHEAFDYRRDGVLSLDGT